MTRSTAARTIKFYVNGVLRATVGYTTDPTPSTRAISIGRSESGIQYVNGYIDEVALYTAPLSATQVARHYVMRLANGIAMPVELPLVASDGNDDALTFSATGLPPGLTIAPSTGLITGTLTKAAAGIYHVTASVSDGCALAQPVVPVDGDAHQSRAAVDGDRQSDRQRRHHRRPVRRTPLTRMATR